MLWPDRPAGLAEIHRVLHPDRRLLLSVHAKLATRRADALAADTRAAGFVDVERWHWDPPGRGASRATQLRAARGP